MSTFYFEIRFVSGSKFCANVKAVSFLDAWRLGTAQYKQSQFNTGDAIKMQLVGKVC